MKRARIVVGLIMFVVAPALVGLIAWGWIGLLAALFFPVGALALGLVVALGLLIEFVFGGSPKQHADRERAARR